MIQIVGIGVAAGIAGALLFLSPIGGTALAFPLFALAGLPIAIAGLGWHLISALIATGVAGLTIAGALSIESALVYIALFSVPILWMCRLAVLSRPAGDDGSALEFFPIGGILFQGALAIAAAAIVVGAVAGYDPVALTAEFTEVLTMVLAQAPEGTTISTEDIAPFAELAEFAVVALPFILPAYLVFVHVFNMWLASRIADASRRLTRPRDPLWTAALPVQASFVFGGALVVSVLPDAIGYIGAAFAGALGAAFALIGLAVIHATTRGNAMRGLILAGVYVFVFLFGFPLLFAVLALIGVAETFLRLRARFAPDPSTNPTNE
ncbi:hypothetical protein [Bauldia sp.]|uniref:hypothetical protein n=1 Tax=Bauldia sp. TaxID=2575872 RepID=UPI003BA98D5B